MEEATGSNNSQENIIDLIDLTKESPISNPIRPKRQCLERLNRNRRTNHVEPLILKPQSSRSQVYETEELEDIVVIANYLKQSQTTTNAASEETIELDDSVIETKEDSKSSAIVSDTGEAILLTCPICFESLSSKQEPISTRCGHIFCSKCLKTCMRTNKKCPTCKANVVLRSCIRLYF